MPFGLADCSDDTLGATVGIDSPPIRRRRPWHGLGDLGIIDVNATRPIRTHVPHDPMQHYVQMKQLAHATRVKDANARSPEYAKWRAQKASKEDRAALVKAASNLPISDTVAILTRTKSVGMPQAEVPLYENLFHSPDAVLEQANEATRFWGAIVAVYDFKHKAVSRRFQLGVKASDLKGYSSADASKFVYLLPNDFNFLADANATERDAYASKEALRQTRSSARVLAKVRKTRN